jgi:hypothetical protein
MTANQTTNDVSVSEALNTYFPDAVAGPELTRRVNELLEAQSFAPATTLLATSTCPDELNRTVTQFEEHWGSTFHLGGLAGLPFTGQSGFDAFRSHIPDDGRAFLVYASHVGITADSRVGRIQRAGQTQTTLSCGAGMGAYEHLKEGGSADDFDGQQQRVASLIDRHLSSLERSREAAAAVPIILFNSIDAEIKQLIPKDLDRTVALLGGIQINTPDGQDDHFLVREFSILRPTDNYTLSLREKLQE